MFNIDPSQLNLNTTIHIKLLSVTAKKENENAEMHEMRDAGFHFLVFGLSSSKVAFLLVLSVSVE